MGELKSFWLLLLLPFLLALGVSGCKERAMSRPPAYMRLGLVSQLMIPETYFPQLRILVRHDERGFSAMSTDCTYDLSPLQLRTVPEGRYWESKFSESKYGIEGRVLHGPATRDLPYYELEIAEGAIGGAPDTLYVLIGKERGAEWRLAYRAGR